MLINPYSYLVKCNLWTRFCPFKRDPVPLYVHDAYRFCVQSPTPTVYPVKWSRCFHPSASRAVSKNEKGCLKKRTTKANSIRIGFFKHFTKQFSLAARHRVEISLWPYRCFFWGGGLMFLICTTNIPYNTRTHKMSRWQFNRPTRNNNSRLYSWSPGYWLNFFLFLNLITIIKQE